MIHRKGCALPGIAQTVRGSNDWEEIVVTENENARITVIPGLLGGKPTIRGLRISVEHVFRALSNGVPESELLADYPDLEPEDFRACYVYQNGRLRIR